MSTNFQLTELVKSQVVMALAEDLHGLPDYTSFLIASGCIVNAQIKTNQEMILCGKDWVDETFFHCDKNIHINWLKTEGVQVKPGEILCEIKGNARAILTAERTALNFLQTLSGVATITHKFVERIKDTHAQILDTRKTIPGLRLAEKYAVTVGGGYNQRIGLYDGVLIKENHIAACGGIKNALMQAFMLTPDNIPIQIEVENYAEFVEALESGAKLVLLDNMSIAEITKCVEFNRSRAKLEVSGNINLDNVLDYAKTGIDRISIGALTKHIQAIDLSLRVKL